MTERNQLKISIKILGKSHALCYSNKTQHFQIITYAMTEN